MNKTNKSEFHIILEFIFVRTTVENLRTYPKTDTDYDLWFLIGAVLILNRVIIICDKKYISLTYFHREDKKDNHYKIYHNEIMFRISRK